MEDAIALHEAFRATGGRDRRRPRSSRVRARPPRGGREDPARRGRVAGLVRARRPLLGFRSRLRFAFGLMTRSKAITYDNLSLARARSLSPRSTRWSRRRTGSLPAVPHRYRQLRCADVPAAAAARNGPSTNRVVVVADVPVFGIGRRAGRLAPGALRLARNRRAGADVHRDDLRLQPMPASRPAAPVSTTMRRRPPGRRIVDFVHGNSAAKFCLQLGHAGRKGATKLMWDGMDRPLARGRLADHIGVALPYYPDSQVPREMSARRHGSREG